MKWTKLSTPFLDEAATVDSSLTPKRRCGLPFHGHVAEGGMRAESGELGIRRET